MGARDDIEAQKATSYVPDIEGLDSVHTPEILQLAIALNASGFNLNRWWVLTPRDWMCPSCKRPKIQIARVAEDGRLYGHLMDHHDHMGDLVKKHFDQRALEGTWATVSLHAEYFVRQLENFISAYDRTLICADRNAADSIGKRKAQTPPEFSFSPQEIQRFIDSGPHRSHQVCGLRAKAVWEERKPFYTLRLNIIKRVVEIGLGPENWYQPSLYTDRPDHIETVARNRLKEYAREQGVEPLHLEAYIKLAGPLPAPKDSPQSWRKQHARLTKPILDKEIKSVAARSNIWKKLPDDWLCPCCKRSKQDIVQWNSQNELTFPAPFARYPLGKGKVGETVLVCNECSRITGHLAKEACVKAEFVSFHDVQSVTTPQVNGPHRVHAIEKVVRVINSIRHRVPPIGRR